MCDRGDVVEEIVFSIILLLGFENARRLLLIIIVNYRGFTLANGRSILRLAPIDVRGDGGLHDKAGVVKRSVGAD